MVIIHNKFHKYLWIPCKLLQWQEIVRCRQNPSLFGWGNTHSSPPQGNHNTARQKVDFKNNSSDNNLPPNEIFSTMFKEPTLTTLIKYACTTHASTAAAAGWGGFFTLSRQMVVSVASNIYAILQSVASDAWGYWITRYAQSIVSSSLCSPVLRIVHQQ